MTKIGINGFGRIGRLVLRSILESGRKDIQVVAINDLGPVETNAHLLRFDSVHGRFPHEVLVVGDSIHVGDHKIKVTAIKDPAQLPHKELGVEIALECTGHFTARDKEGRLLNSVRAIGTLGGATIDNEENYLIKKLFGGGLGVVSIENQARI